MVACSADVPCRNTALNCTPDGHCVVPRCDEPQGPVCPTHFRCDPAATLDEPTTSTGSSVFDNFLSQGISAIDSGCVRKRCDEVDGYVCQENWACTPGSKVNGSGCEPVPCTESGKCSDDAVYICTPTSAGPRVSAIDPQGCVPRNCEEGATCSYLVADPAGSGFINISYCDPNGLSVSLSGCAMRPCDAATPCAFGLCDPGAATADELGCRKPMCPDELACPGGATCQTTASGVWDCVYGAAGAGGGGAAGSGGGAGAGSSGASDSAGSSGAGLGGVGSGGVSSGHGGASASAAVGGAAEPTAVVGHCAARE